jgi:poly-gamma-glutamate synthesis protein (capsule biosynthesis protein)
MMHRFAAAMAAVALAAPAATPSAAPAADGGAEPRSFTLAAAGDVLIHRAMAQVADGYAPGPNTYDFTPIMRPIEPWISEADVAICQMEVTLSHTNTGLTYYPRFRVPHELADTLAEIGFDVCTMASNHALDYGIGGLADTLEILHAAGIRTTGTARTADERLPILYEANGVLVGHMAYAYGQNSRPPGEERWSVNYLDAEAILADAAWLREQGAEFVILSMHAGNEYRVRPSWRQTALAEELLPSPDIDLILGHHVHVVQPIQRIGDEYVVYGMSNFVSNIRTNPSKGRYGPENGIVVHAHVAEQPDGTFAVERLEYTPTWMDTYQKRLLPVRHSLLTGVGDPQVLQRSWDSTVSRVDSLGPNSATPTDDPWPPLTCEGRLATILGTRGDDVLVGTDGDDVIVGRDGDDAIWAGGGEDLVCAGDGDDSVNGGDGDDRLLGGDGDDLLLGYQGSDVVWGEAGDDVLGGGDDDDLLIGGSGDDGLQGGEGADFLWGGSGTNRSDHTAEDHCVAAGCD